MTSAASARGRSNRSRGNEAEQVAARWLTAEGWPTETSRNAERGKGRQSRHGDLIIADAGHVVVDVKVVARPRIAAWLEQLDVEGEAVGSGCRALLWKHPDAVRARPGEWLAVAANEPMGYFSHEIGRPHTFDAPMLDAPCLRSVLGWLDVEHRGMSGGYFDRHPALYWQDWLLMRASTWAAEVLPCWEGLA